jgi:hypothetical protein
VKAETPALHDNHIERSVDDGDFFDSIPLARMETFVKDRDGNGALGISFIDPTERFQDLYTEGNIVGSWVAPATKERVMGVIVRDTDQL